MRSIRYALVEQAVTIDHVVTKTEAEALHLEASLVKRHQPAYNVRLKDDKHYPFLKIDVTEPWPRVYITRRVERDRARYFGPYASAKSVRTTLDLVKKLFPWRSCTKVITGTDPRPCLDYYINRCIAPCTSYCTPAEYREVIDQVILFLEGRTDVVVRELKQQMAAAAEELEFDTLDRVVEYMKAHPGGARYGACERSVKAPRPAPRRSDSLRRGLTIRPYPMSFLFRRASSFLKAGTHSATGV